MPYGYELASTGDINLNEGGNSVNIVVREKDYNQSVFVNYVDEDGNLVLSESIKVYKGTEYINTGDLNSHMDGKLQRRATCLSKMVQ